MTLGSDDQQHGVVCPTCASTNVRTSHPVRDHYGTSRLTARYVRCRTCRTKFLPRLWTEQENLELYPPSYLPYRTSDVAPEPWSGTQRLSERLREFYTSGSHGGTLLDFGCGGPAFLNLARELGWAGIGSDFSAAALEHVSQAGFRAVAAADLDSIDTGSIDRIRMNHVLEHLPDPHPTLAALYSKLSPAGRLHVAVPNPDGPSGRLFRSSWWGSEPRHIRLYGPGPLRRVLADAGFTAVDIVMEGTAKDFMRSLLIACGRPEAAAASPRSRWALERLARAAATAGLGDRVHAFANH